MRLILAMMDVCYDIHGGVGEECPWCPFYDYCVEEGTNFGTNPSASAETMS